MFDKDLDKDIAEATSWGCPDDISIGPMHSNFCNLIARMRYRISGYEELLDKSGIKYTYSKTEMMQAYARGEEITCLKLAA